MTELCPIETPSERMPTLHEIAAMPFPASVQAVRRFYDPKWHTDFPEHGDGPRQFRVRMRWSIYGTFDDVIEAESEEEARQIAEESCRDDVWSGDLDTQGWKIEDVTSQDEEV